jgi:hypothetical protein
MFSPRGILLILVSTSGSPITKTMEFSFGTLVNYLDTTFRGLSFKATAMELSMRSVPREFIVHNPTTTSGCPTITT